MPLKKITAADFNTAIKKLTTSDASVWWKTLGETEDGTKLCFVMGWNDGYDADEDGTMYQQDGYTLCTKIGYKPSNLMVMDYTDFNMPYDKKTAEVWDTDMSVGKGEVTDDAFDVKWYNDEAEAIWKKYGKPDRDGKTALDLMESKNKEAKKHTCSMQKKKESLAKKNERLFTLYDIHGKYPNFWKTAPWRTSQFWKEYEDYYSKAYPTMGIKITMTGDDSVDVTSNGKFIMNYSWKNGRHRATAEDGSGFKHPGFGFRDDLSMIYRGITGKEMGPYKPVYVDESRKKCEEYIPNVRERLWSFIDAGFITTEEIGDYLLRALSVDTLENVYEWLVQDEMIPSEETLADEHQLKFGDDGEFVSIETDDTKED